LSDYFSDRELGPKPQTEELISTKVWGGIVALVDGLIDQGAFGNDYPELCPDGPAVVGTNRDVFGRIVQAEIPGLVFPLQGDRISDSEEAIESYGSTLAALDFLEFCHQHVAEVEKKDYHSYFRHYHLEFNTIVGQTTFRESINRIFVRNGIAFHLHHDGTIRRRVPVPVRSIRNSEMPSSGDPLLDGLIAQSLSMFSNVDPAVRKDALDKLWDAWERLKSIDDTDKKKSVQKLLAMAAASGPFADLLQEEARKLTEFGNSFQIRHWETNKEPLTEPMHGDYLYARLLSLIHLLLSAKNRAVD
jgi:hypothetical protein